VPHDSALADEATAYHQAEQGDERP
jgi:hypothetical protein